MKLENNRELKVLIEKQATYPDIKNPLCYNLYSNLYSLETTNSALVVYRNLININRSIIDPICDIIQQTCRVFETTIKVKQSVLKSFR